MTVDTAVTDAGREPGPIGAYRWRSRRPLRSEDDPFYRPPTGFGAERPGTLLRSRRVETALFGAVGLKFPAWQLLYRSTDLDGRPDASVTTVLLPAKADPAQHRPLLSYQCAIDAIASMGMPSYLLQRGAKAVAAAPQFEFLLVLSALAKGWAVSIPDHEGTGGHWGAPREPGYRVLDGIRAAIDFEPLGLAADTRVGIWGYSGGGLASTWAAEMAPEYAPELDVVGVALGSPVGDPAAAFSALNGTLFAGLPALVISALRRVYPNLDRAIRTHSTIEGLSLLKSIESMSTIGAMRKLARKDMGDFLDIPLADLLALPDVLHVFRDIQLGLRAPTAPLLMVQSVHDHIVSVDDVDAQAERYRKAGAHVTYLRDRLSEHLTLHPIATPMTLNWFADRFAKKPLPAPSTRTVWSTAGTRSALIGLASMWWVIVKALLGRRI